MAGDKKPKDEKPKSEAKKDASPKNDEPPDIPFEIFADEAVHLTRKIIKRVEDSMEKCWYSGSNLRERCHNFAIDTIKAADLRLYRYNSWLAYCRNMAEFVAASAVRRAQARREALLKHSAILCSKSRAIAKKALVTAITAMKEKPWTLEKDQACRMAARQLVREAIWDAQNFISAIPKGDRRDTLDRAFPTPALRLEPKFSDFTESPPPYFPAITPLVRQMPKTRK